MTAPARVELVFDPDCPNVEKARAAIRTALLTVGAPPQWTEWRRGTDATPAEFRELGSPSVLVNGRDVDSSEALRATANSCRIYVDECGCLCGAPTTEQIVRAIQMTH